MRNDCFITVALVVVAALVLVPMAMADDYRSVGDVYYAAWDNPDNWEILVDDIWIPAGNNEYPQSCEDTAWIRDGYKIMVRAEDNDEFTATCGAVYVDDGGIIYHPGGNTLVLCDFDESYVNGQIGTTCEEVEASCAPSVLMLDGSEGNVTINGNGGIIVTGADSNAYGAAALEIDGGGASAGLVIAGSTPGSLATSMSIVARYNWINIETYLANGGDVQAEMTPDEDAGVMLTGEAKGGALGYYRAVERADEGAVGSIEVDSAVAGMCDFEVLDPYARITINHAMSCYAGDFKLEAGRLEFYASVCTSGKFTIGKSGGTNSSQIFLGTPSVFKWAADCGCE